MQGYNVTFGRITEDSAREGEYAESGFIAQNVSLREAIKLLEDGPGEMEGPSEANVYPLCPAVRWVSQNYKVMEGAVIGESRALHIPDSVSGSSRVRIARMLLGRPPFVPDTAKHATDTLNRLVDFDCPFRSFGNGYILHGTGIYTPEIIMGNEIDDKAQDKYVYPFPGEPQWELISGFSGQSQYCGPVMHNSEYLGGSMAQYVLETPGVYVVMAVSWEDDENPCSEADGYYEEGWVLARLKD